MKPLILTLKFTSFPVPWSGTRNRLLLKGSKGPSNSKTMAGPAIHLNRAPLCLVLVTWTLLYYNASTHCNCTELCTAVQCTVLHCTVQQCTVLHCTVQQCTVLHCTVQQCTSLSCHALHWYERYFTAAMNFTVTKFSDMNFTLLIITVLRCSSLQC